ncbi:alginate biosynthesis regulator [Alcanivorax xiamenensis]|uniref:Alginate biosynthesis regulator n=1 Tax=Alcanivorax xiamenensis TaxID=1177156 RepID=A0ABQ6Y7V4_9GAMM|nr:LytTR family DNA-binding domain-containing protein [Alcanivorax xiamenensis]KAF0805589.1 alginate biosynthesis regulator [Alcanivorax xiamenensis]
MRVLVCDDEALARMRLKRLVERCDMEVVAEASTGREALASASRLHPDVVLMDIRMPDMDGLEAGAHLTRLEPAPAVIFCTAFEEHALQAFRVHALDYLLKPVSEADLRQALEKVRALNQVQLAEVQHRMAANRPRQRRHISARTYRGLELVQVEDVRYFQADQKYVTVYHTGGSVVINEPLKDLEKEFDGLFVRTHRSTLVALHYIEALEHGGSDGGYEVRLRDLDVRLPVSRRHLAGLRQALLNRN